MLSRYNYTLKSLNPVLSRVKSPSVYEHTKTILWPNSCIQKRSVMESAQDESPGVTLEELPKSNTFTCKLPADPAFETPKSSHHAPRETLGPRLVRGALFTYVRPESTDSSELLCVSDNAMKDIGLKEEEKKKQLFKDVVSGNHIFWTEDNGGIYPWAQCYGGKFSYFC